MARERSPRARRRAIIVIDANELEIPGYAANPTNRCYFCKDSLYEICAAEARAARHRRTSSTA